VQAAVELREQRPHGSAAPSPSARAQLVDPERHARDGRSADAIESATSVCRAQQPNE
jgi:hypothetical protein